VAPLARRMVPSTSMCYVYILRCADGSLYVGWTQNLDDRLSAHNEGRGSTYTFKRRPVCLMYSESFHSEAEAIRRERQLKRWSVAKKESLISGDFERLKHLSKPRGEQICYEDEAPEHSRCVSRWLRRFPKQEPACMVPGDEIRRL